MSVFQRIKDLFFAVKDKVGSKLRLDTKQKKALLMNGGGVLAICITLVLLVVLQDPVPDQSGALEDPLETLTDLTSDEEYTDNDIFANVLSSGEYSGTVLGLTPDAGVGYVRETLFIGDSNTAGMILNSSVTNVTMDNGIGIVSMGISHVMSLKCVKFSGMEAVAVPEAVKIMQPRRIVITYGTNDYYMKPEEFSEKYKQALDAINDAYPYSDIIIGSIFPITSNCSYYTVSMPTIEKFNVELVKIAQEKGVSFLNWSEALKDPKTGYCKSEYMAGDGVHLSKKGMEAIFDYFRTHKQNGEDKRPKPLDPVPAREPTPPGLLGSGPRTPVDTPPPEPPAETGLVTVVFTAGAGGSIAGGSSFSLAPGGTTGSVTAQAQPGYVFVGWSDGNASASRAFTVPAGAAPGSSFVITAMFQAVQSEEPPVEPPPVEPPPVEPPPVEPPPVEPPPVEPPPVEPPPVEPPPVEPPPAEPPPAEPPIE